MRTYDCKYSKVNEQELEIDIVDSVNNEEKENDGDIDKRLHCRCQCHNKRTTQRDCPQFADSKPGSKNSCDLNSDDFCIKLDNDSLKSSTTDCSKTNRERTNSRTRYKFPKRQSDTVSNNKSQPTKHLCQKLRTVLSKRQNMIRIICHCAIILTLCLCGGVLMINHSSDKSNKHNLHHMPSAGLKMDDNYNYEMGASHLLMDMDFRSVSKDDFEKHLSRSKSAADMLKIFFDDPNLSEDQVNSIMYMKSHQSIHGSNSKREQHNQNFVNDGQADMEEHREEAYRHHLDIAKSPVTACHDPVPEVQRVFSVETDSFRTYYPSCTIVHRCKPTSGCCPAGSVCGPKKDSIRIFDKYFLVFETTSGGDMVRPDSKHFVEGKAFVNHTECECTRVNTTPPSCQKRCPHYFTKQHSGTSCQCVCKIGNRACRHMQRGFVPLLEKDLECIKRDECTLPKCHKGSFKINTGFCPRSHKSKKG